MGGTFAAVGFLPGLGDDIKAVGKAIRGFLKSSDEIAGTVKSIDELANTLKPTSDTDVLTLFRGTTGNENRASSVFLTDI